MDLEISAPRRERRRELKSTRCFDPFVKRLPSSADDISDDDPTSVEDAKFDLIYPPQIRKLSSVFWTPVHIAAEAARLLVSDARTRVLDIGCGPGKFCLLGAQLTEGRFTGVEQRGDLVAVARRAAADLELSEVDFLHLNVADVSFAEYDAFYIFNPFEENMFQAHKIDATVPLSPELFRRYTSHVAAELGARPLGTRVVTYMGYADEIPCCYDCESALFGDDLKLWVKARDYDPEIERLGLTVSRSYRGSAGWVPPRNL
jgi:SAM-dependent methyltransferase